MKQETETHTPRDYPLTDIMIDLETMGKSKNAAVASIGAVFFDPLSDEIGHKFYVKVGIESSIQAGLECHGDTIKWWLGQSKEARQELIQGPHYDLKDALDNFTSWLLVHNATPRQHFNIWCHATFDAPVLENAFKAVGIPWPFSYRATRDLRTLQYLSTEMNIPRHGTYHNALDDCLYQISAVQHQIRIMADNGHAIL